MTVTVEILGDGHFAGAQANVADYSINEDASPISLAELQGGVGGITFNVIEQHGFDGSMFLPRQPFRIVDSYSGAARGVIDNGASSDGITLSVQASGSLLPLVSQRSMPAVTGALGNVLISWLDACGMSDVTLQIEQSIALKPVTLPSWTGEVWSQIKKLMAIHRFEMADVDGTIVVRSLRKRSVDVTRYTGTRLNYGQDSAYQTVQVYYYNNQWVANKSVYPGKDTTILTANIISVNAGEEVKQNVPVDMWISSIDEPEQQTHLEWQATPPPASQYAVVDQAGVPVSPGDWANGGGYMKLEVGADGKSVDITIRGMAANGRGPYRIASSSADKEYQFSALYIAATGVAFDKQMIWSATGADLIDAPVDQVQVIDEPMVSTRGEAIYVLANAALDGNGFSQTFEADTTHINRRGDVGTILYPPFADYNASLPVAYTFGDFTSASGAQTFSQFTAAQGKLVEESFDSQAFGGIGGARVRERDAFYRITSGRAGPDGFTWSATQDTLFLDWKDVQDASMTFGTFNSKWTGKTFEQHNRMPLYS